MSADNNGGPAFPHPAWAGSLGMSLRDWFAGQALAGMLAGYLPTLSRNASKTLNIDPRTMGVAYEIADAMLRAREGGTR